MSCITQIFTLVPGLHNRSLSGDTLLFFLSPLSFTLVPTYLSYICTSLPYGPAGCHTTPRHAILQPSMNANQPAATSRPQPVFLPPHSHPLPRNTDRVSPCTSKGPVQWRSSLDARRWPHAALSQSFCRAFISLVNFIVRWRVLMCVNVCAVLSPCPDSETWDGQTIHPYAYHSFTKRGNTQSTQN